MFLPIKDINPTTRTPVVTIALIVLNALVFLYELSLGRQLGGFVAGFGAVPYEITQSTDLVGRYPGSPVVHAPGPPIIWLTLFTSMFMHGGFMHIIGNMLYLWIFGNNIEDLMGPVKFLLFYLGCGLAAAFAHIVSAPNSPIPTVGASGAVSGILGAYLVAYPRARVVCLVFLFYFIRLITESSYSRRSRASGGLPGYLRANPSSHSSRRKAAGSLPSGGVKLGKCVCVKSMRALQRSAIRPAVSMEPG